MQVQVQMQSCRGGAEVVQRYRYGGVLRNLGSAEVRRCRGSEVVIPYYRADAEVQVVALWDGNGTS